MPREKESYRDTLADILEYFGGKRLLSVTDVSRYTQLNRRTVIKRYQFQDGYISAMVLARAMS